MARPRRQKDGLSKRCEHHPRQWLHCECDWFFDFYFDHTRYRFNLRTLAGKPLGYVMPKSEAITLRDDFRTQIKKRTFVDPRDPAPVPAIPIDAQYTFSVVAKDYRDRHVSTLADGALDAHDAIVKFLDGVTLPPGLPFTSKLFKAITQEDVEIAYAAKRERKTETITKNGKTWTRTVGGLVTANRMIAHLTAMWSWATSKKRRYATESPFRDGDKVPDELKKAKEHHRERRLAEGEEAALLTHAGPHLHDCIVAILEAGLRKGELLSLTWGDVLWLQNEIVVRWQNCKTRETRKIPMSPTLREMLVQRQKAHPKDAPWKPSAFVFGNEVGEPLADIRTAWRLTCARATITDLHIHDLRHEAISRKADLGWPEHVRMKWAGHKDSKTAARYTHAASLHDYTEFAPLRMVKG